MLYLLKWVTECVCVCGPWRVLEVLIPACDHRDSVMTVLHVPSLVSPSSSSLLASCVTQKALNASSAQLKKQHCWRILILIDYMAASWYTKGLWMGGKWSTWWYRFIWSAIWVFLLSGFLGDWALLLTDVSRHSHLGLLFTLSAPVSLSPSDGVNCKTKLVDWFSQTACQKRVHVHGSLFENLFYSRSPEASPHRSLFGWGGRL